MRKKFLDSSFIYFSIIFFSSIYKLLKTSILAVFQYNIKILIYLKCLVTLHDIWMLKSLLSHLCFNHLLFLLVIANFIQFYSFNCILFVIDLRFVQLNFTKCPFTQDTHLLQVELFQLLTLSLLFTLFFPHLFISSANSLSDLKI